MMQRDDMTIVLNDREFGRAVRKVGIGVKIEYFNARRVHCSNAGNYPWCLTMTSICVGIYNERPRQDRTGEVQSPCARKEFNDWASGAKTKEEFNENAKALTGFDRG